MWIFAAVSSPLRCLANFSIVVRFGARPAWKASNLPTKEMEKTDKARGIMH